MCDVDLKLHIYAQFKSSSGCTVIHMNHELPLSEYWQDGNKAFAYFPQPLLLEWELPAICQNWDGAETAFQSTWLPQQVFQCYMEPPDHYKVCRMRGNSFSDHMLLHKHLAFPTTHLKIFVLKPSLTASDNLKEQPKMMKTAEAEFLSQNCQCI